MTASTDFAAAPASPQSGSPVENEPRPAVVLVCVFAPPLAWLIQLLFNFALTSRTCYPRDVPLLQPVAGTAWVWATVLGVNIAALLIALAAGISSARIYRAATKRTSAGHSRVEVGEGRTSFLALCGIMTGIAFAAAIVFDTFGIFLVRECLV